MLTLNLVFIKSGFFKPLLHVKIEISYRKWNTLKSIPSSKQKIIWKKNQSCVISLYKTIMVRGAGVAW